MTRENGVNAIELIVVCRDSHHSGSGRFEPADFPRKLTEGRSGAMIVDCVTGEARDSWLTL